MIRLKCLTCGIEFDSKIDEFFPKGNIPIKEVSYCEKHREEKSKKAEEEKEKERIIDRKKNPEKYMAMAGIRKRFLKAKLEGIKLPKRILSPVMRFLKDSSKGLFFTGAVGSGKTYLACAIARELTVRGDNYLFQSVPVLLQKIRQTFGKASKEDEYRLIRRYSDVACLILDDLGSEKQSDFSLDRLYVIIDYRYSEMMPTIITSNFSLDEMKEKIHDRIASRLAEMCENIEFPETDLRIEG